jgi:hypothetical protein
MNAQARYSYDRTEMPLSMCDWLPETPGKFPKWHLSQLLQQREEQRNGSADPVTYEEECFSEKGDSSETTFLDEILMAVKNMECEDSLYDEDYLKPTQFAFNELQRIFESVQLTISTSLTLGAVYPDGDGGIRVEWIYGEREVKLIIKNESTDRHYLFFKRGKAYGGVYDITPTRVEDYLNWLTNNDREER